MVADPLHLLDWAARSTRGGGAIIVTRESGRSRWQSPHPSPALLGYGKGHNHIDVNAVESMTTFPATRIPRPIQRLAWRRFEP